MQMYATDCDIRNTPVANILSVWANNARKTYYPTTTDNGFYTGSTSEFDFIGRHDGHYAWEWGDALFIGLDAFWYAPGGNSTPWDRTLGYEQIVTDTGTFTAPARLTGEWVAIPGIEIQPFDMDCSDNAYL